MRPGRRRSTAPPSPRDGGGVRHSCREDGRGEREAGVDDTEAAATRAKEEREAAPRRGERGELRAVKGPRGRDRCPHRVRRATRRRQCRAQGGEGRSLRPDRGGEGGGLRAAWRRRDRAASAPLEEERAAASEQQKMAAATKRLEDERGYAAAIAQLHAATVGILLQNAVDLLATVVCESRPPRI